MRAHDRQQAAPAAEPKIIRCERERPLPLPIARAAAAVTRAAPDSSRQRRAEPGSVGDSVPRSPGLNR